MRNQAVDTVVPARLSQFSQVVMHRTIAVHGTTLQPGLLDMTNQAPIFNTTFGVGIAAPRVVAAGMPRHYRAQTTYRILAPHARDKYVPHSHVFAKYAAANFRMSRSSVTRLSSALSLRISASWPWAVILPRCSRSPCACRDREAILESELPFWSIDTVVSWKRPCH